MEVDERLRSHLRILSSNDNINFIVEHIAELSDQESNQLFEALAYLMSAEHISHFINSANPVELERCSLGFCQTTDPNQGDIPAEAKEMIKSFSDELQKTMEEYAKQQLEEYKRTRNRKSSLKTIRRNVEICDLRKQNRRKWSLVKLATHFKTSQRTITLVLSEEDKWRRLLDELPGSK